MRRVLSTVALGMLALALAACYGLQDVVDYCVDPATGQENGACPPCSADTDCVIVSNPCHETASCTHAATNLAVDQIGCNWEYDVPSNDVCRCVAGVCRSD